MTTVKLAVIPGREQSSRTRNPFQWIPDHPYAASGMTAWLAPNTLDLRPRRGALEFRWRLLAVLLPGFAAFFENDVPDCRVRRRHRVEAVDLVDLVGERAAHDEPH